jgi:hypothetical protein
MSVSGKVPGKLCGVAQAGVELCNMEGDDMDNACHHLLTMHCVMVCYMDEKFVNCIQARPVVQSPHVPRWHSQQLIPTFGDHQGPN